ncbi:MAG: hypothetical protein HN696_05395 [Euryarchaeota archaeon]|nr:hypothetical protein [Euryarchaeota archaeon]
MMSWNPERGPPQRVEIGEIIVTACLIPSPQNSIQGVVMFSKQGSIIHLSIPSLVPISSTRLDGWFPESAQTVHINGIAHIILSHDKSIEVRCLDDLKKIVSIIEFENKVNLLYLDGDKLVVIQGMKTAEIQIQDIIPLP